jgi:hypothetical protein
MRILLCPTNTVGLRKKPSLQPAPQIGALAAGHARGAFLLADIDVLQDLLQLPL